MKHYILLIALLPILSFGQVEIQNNLLSTAGATHSNGAVVMDYSFGEVFTATLNNGSNALTQGFQQRWRNKLSIVSTELDSAASITDEEIGTINVYPNPTFNHVFIEIETEKPYMVDIIDMAGRKVNSFDLFGMKNQIDLSIYENGTYNLLIHLSEGKSFRLPIVKVN